jgi:hypothetical protein
LVDQYWMDMWIGGGVHGVVGGSVLDGQVDWWRGASCGWWISTGWTGGLEAGCMVWLVDQYWMDMWIGGGVHGVVGGSLLDGLWLRSEGPCA